MTHSKNLSLTGKRRVIAGGIGAFALAAGALVTGLSLPSASAATWPSANGSEPVSATKNISGSVDGGMKRYYGTGNLGTGGQEENQSPLFKLADGATLKNVILGAPAADGIHCSGSCTLQNVWWEDVGEDAATFRGTGKTYTVTGGGARKASDKIFQFNGGGTLNISNFAAQDFKTFVRSCGNCSTQHKRTINVSNTEITAPGGVIGGINTNYGDSLTLRGITIIGDSSRKIVPCQKYLGNNTGAEPTKNGSNADGTHCKYSASDLTYR
ncbi:pectate lyase [Streptomyces sp. 549]|uniref:pectate lyase n=1 Tax=Streptomyces sp. 549 TaxID=3049076 RepID=UPI0024C30353|nr:pectate lyase [Streptomyces sp. 549]MDK1473352.1 pectate lyase [Streptomyces sp. 549]